MVAKWTQSNDTALRTSVFSPSSRRHQGPPSSSGGNGLHFFGWFVFLLLFCSLLCLCTIETSGDTSSHEIHRIGARIHRFACRPRECAVSNRFLQNRKQRSRPYSSGGYQRGRIQCFQAHGRHGRLLCYAIAKMMM